MHTALFNQDLTKPRLCRLRKDISLRISVVRPVFPKLAITNGKSGMTKWKFLMLRNMKTKKMKNKSLNRDLPT